MCSSDLSDVMLSRASAGDTNGFKDISVSVGTTHKPYGSLTAIYHKFDSVENDLDYGSEIDILYAYPVGERTDLMIKGAMYNAGTAAGFVDTNKLWVMTHFEF